MSKTLIIGVAGGTGSGKTTLAKRLHDEFSNISTLLCHDYYYKDNSDLAFEDRCCLNYDHPDAFDTHLLVEDLKLLRQGKKIAHPVYSFTEHTRLDEKVDVEATPIIIVEGILLFENDALVDQCDIKVFVDTDADVRLIRRVMRDVEERGRTLDSVVNQYLSTVKPMHEQFVEPSKRKCDIIIPEGGYNTVALTMLFERIRSFIVHDLGR